MHDMSTLSPKTENAMSKSKYNWNKNGKNWSNQKVFTAILYLFITCNHYFLQCFANKTPEKNLKFEKS